MSVTTANPASDAVKSAKPMKRKRKPKTTETKSIFTSIEPVWTYLHLTLMTSRADTVIDALTLRSCLLQAFSAYLGDHGAAIPIDILYIGEEATQSAPRRPCAYVRVPNEDAQAAIAGVTSFTGSGSVLAIRVKGHSSWLSTLTAGVDGQELFEMTLDKSEDEVRRTDQSEP